jgi:alkylation response protein AidB-like acyl-CoA dehydrogenase
MDFALSDEQRMIVETTRAFVENEIYPHEAEVEQTGHLRRELIETIKPRAIDSGLYAANIPEEHGGAGLDTLTWLLYERELGRANYALHWTCVARPSNILCAGTPEQRERYLAPCVRGETWDCLAMTEPDAGSDLRGMKATARPDGTDWILDGTKHFISHADIAGFTIAFMATGSEETSRGPKKRITAFFVDKGTPGFTVRDGYRNVSHRGYTNAILEFDACRVPAENVLGEPHRGFEVANSWLGATRLQVAATCLGRAERAFAHAVDWAASRRQFGAPIGRNQGVSFQLADMATGIKATELMLLEAGWKYDQGRAVSWRSSSRPSFTWPWCNMSASTWLLQFSFFSS